MIETVGVYIDSNMVKPEFNLFDMRDFKWKAVGLGLLGSDIRIMLGYKSTLLLEINNNKIY